MLKMGILADLRCHRTLLCSSCLNARHVLVVPHSAVCCTQSLLTRRLTHQVLLASHYARTTPCHAKKSTAHRRIVIDMLNCMWCTLPTGLPDTAIVTGRTRHRRSSPRLPTYCSPFPSAADAAARQLSVTFRRWLTGSDFTPAAHSYTPSFARPNAPASASLALSADGISHPLWPPSHSSQLTTRTSNFCVAGLS